MFLINTCIKGPFQMERQRKANMKRGIMLIQTFVLNVISNERNILTNRKIIDCIAEQNASVCKESKLSV